MFDTLWQIAQIYLPIPNDADPFFFFQAFTFYFTAVKTVLVFYSISLLYPIRYGDRVSVSILFFPRLPDNN